jgi:hypothetical protein
MPRQVADVDPSDHITANAAMESQGLATAIADNLQEAGFRGASAQPAEAAITTVTVTEIPPPVPVKTPVLMGQTKVMGCPAMDDTEKDTFATQFGAAVATELAVDAPVIRTWYAELLVVATCLPLVNPDKVLPYPVV